MHLLFKKLMKLNVGTCIPLFFTAVQIGVFAKEPVVEVRQEVTDESAPVLRVVVDDGFCPMSFYEAGMNEHLTKPVDGEKLLQVLYKYKKRGFNIKEQE